MTNSEPEMELSSSSAQPHPFNGQIEELQRLVLSSGPEQGDFGSKCQEAASELDKIASKLRDRKLAVHFLIADNSLEARAVCADRLAASSGHDREVEGDRQHSTGEAVAAGWTSCCEPLRGV